LFEWYYLALLEPKNLIDQSELRDPYYYISFNGGDCGRKKPK
jgi:hypothetical protein